MNAHAKTPENEHKTAPEYVGLNIRRRVENILENAREGEPSSIAQIGAAVGWSRARINRTMADAGVSSLVLISRLALLLCCPVDALVESSFDRIDQTPHPPEGWFLWLKWRCTFLGFETNADVAPLSAALELFAKDNADTTTGDTWR